VYESGYSDDNSENVNDHDDGMMMMPTVMVMMMMLTLLELTTTCRWRSLDDGGDGVFERLVNEEFSLSGL